MAPDGGRVSRDPNDLPARCSAPRGPRTRRRARRRRIGEEPSPLAGAPTVRQFNDPLLNPHNAQLIFTTHDTNLVGTVVGEPVLRRDQIWLTEKDEQGATQLYPLTDYQPRKQENVERGYLQGRYGAIPFLGALVPAASDG